MKQKDLDLISNILEKESPEVRDKVYKIVDKSGLDASDPLFLILVLTGQMRVFLETAPADLEKLLLEWKQHSEESLNELKKIILKIELTQEQKTNTIKEILQKVISDCSEQIKQVGSATTSAIANSNNETVNQAKLATLAAEKLKDSVVKLLEEVTANKNIVAEKMQPTITQIENSIEGMNTATQEISSSVDEIKQLRQQIKQLQNRTIFIKLGDWFWPLFILFTTLLIGFSAGAWLISVKYKEDPINILGRNLVNWNTDRILKCQRNQSPKCTLWINPPQERSQGKNK